MIKAVGKTDTGKIRDHNEDSILILDAQNVFSVADGVGGNVSGEIASSKAMEILKKSVEKSKKDSFDDKFFLDIFLNIDKEITKISNKDKTKIGMATTLVLAYIKDNRFLIGNTGDSRAYLINKDFMLQVTDDHSFVDELIRAGKITEEEAKKHPNKNIITKALGFSDNPKPDFFIGDINNGDYILLCSDGLTNEVVDAEIEKIIRQNTKLETKVKRLVDKANENGGKDNISVVLVKVS